MLLFFPIYSSFFLPPRNNNRFFFYLTLLLCFFPSAGPFSQTLFLLHTLFYPSSSPRQEGERGAKPAQVRTAAAAALPFLPTVVH